MVRPREMKDAVVHGGVRVPRPLGAELPYRPVGAMSVVEIGDEVG